MRNSRGSTIVELLIASAVLLLVVAAVTRLLHDGLIGVPALEEAGDLHQRARIVADTLAADLRNVGAGGEFGRLSTVFAPVLPRRVDDGAATVFTDVLTAVAVSSHGATSRLIAPLAAGAPTALIEAVSGCPVGTTACGFNTGMRALLFDVSGAWDVVSVDAIGPGLLTISDVGAGRAMSYPAGTPVAELTMTSYDLDRGSRELRRSTGASRFTLADHVVDVRFAYFDGTLAPLPLAVFTDGPFRGGGATMFDDDLRRVRSVRVTLRLESGDERLRGSDPWLFARPGSATARRMLPDLVTTLEVTLRNGGER